MLSKGPGRSTHIEGLEEVGALRARPLGKLHQEIRQQCDACFEFRVYEMGGEKNLRREQPSNLTSDGSFSASRHPSLETLMFDQYAAHS